ncbi:MAG: ABC transporter substrate-binding protein, partial [Desulfomonilaceae bacterium]
MCIHCKDKDDISSCSSSLGNAFDADVSLEHGSLRESPSGSSIGLETHEDVIDRAIENAVVKAVFGGSDVSRRNFMKLVGSSTAMAVLSSVFPMEAAKAWAKDAPGPLEKKDLKIGFIPITCATPIIMAEPMKLYEKHGLTGTKVVKAAGWAMIRDWAVANQVDCAHMLSPMPLAMTIGAGSTATPFYMPAIENINGQAITLHIKHKAAKEPRD